MTILESIVSLGKTWTGTIEKQHIDLTPIAKPNERATRNEDDIEETLQDTDIGKDNLNS